MNQENTFRQPIIVLGSTGSVGKQALDVAEKMNFPVEAISANTNVDIVEAQARKFHVKYCAMGDAHAAEELRIRLADLPVKVFSGVDGICQMIREAKSTLVLNSIIGEAGLFPTLTTLQEKKQLALSNKESLVVAGDLVMRTARGNGISIRPVDSEHCAIFQSLMATGAGGKKEVKRLLLTASGGPFFEKNKEELKKVRVQEALAHPTWRMGAKITVDCATMMNKGFEIIEASWLFDIPEERIDVVVHRESIIHSMVEYIDHSVIAQMAVPDMRLCVQHALTYPQREDSCVPPLDFYHLSHLTFAKPDEDTFILLRLARECLRKGGAMTAIVNAANEVAVDAFLKDKIRFYDISEIVLRTVNALSAGAEANSMDIQEILYYDKSARNIALELLHTM